MENVEAVPPCSSSAEMKHAHICQKTQVWAMSSSLFPVLLLAAFLVNFTT